MASEIMAALSFHRNVFFQIGLVKRTNKTKLPYRPRASATEWTAIALQFRCGEGLVNICDGVGTDNSFAPEQKT